MGGSAAPQTARKKLDVSHTVGESFTSITENPGAFLRAALLPGLIYILLGLSPFLFALLWQGPLQQTVRVIYPYWGEAVLILNAAAAIYFAVAWHRFMLLGDTKGEPRLLRAWRRPHWRFLLYTVTNGVVPYLVLSIALILVVNFLYGGRGFSLGWPATIIGFLIAAAFIWLWLRFSMVFPAAAVDVRGYGFKQAWHDSEGNVLRIVLVFLLVYLPVLLILWLLSYLAVGLFGVQIFGAAIGMPTFEMIVGLTVLLVIQVWLMGVTVSIFSIAFRELASWTPSLQQDGTVTGRGEAESR